VFFKYLLNHFGKIFEFVLFILSFGFGFLFAQWPTSVQEELFVGYGDSPKAVSDGNGGAFIAATYHSFYSSVRIQRISKDGDIVWNDSLILTGSKHQQVLFDADIISDGKGGMYL
jgi:hypothetical protein